MSRIFFSLVFFLSIVINCIAQNQADLTVGDDAPLMRPYKWIKGKPVNFQKGKNYLIEFGATWCVPCRAAIPHLSALQKRFEDSLTVVSFFVMEQKKSPSDVSYLKTVERFLKAEGNKINYIVGVDDPKGSLQNNWLTAAGLGGVPYAFLIDKSGKVAWIGNPNSPDMEQAIAMIQAKDYTIEKAIAKNKLNPVSLSVDHRIPLYMKGNGGTGDRYFFRSLLAPYSGESSGNYDFIYSGYRSKWSADLLPERMGMVQQIGVPIDKLYYLAYGDTMSPVIVARHPVTKQYETVLLPLTVNRYGDFWYRAILEVSDSTPFKFHSGTKNTFNKYNYSLVVPDEAATAEYMQKVMRSELDLFFGYQVSVEERMMPYWKLAAKSNARQILSAKTPQAPYKFEKMNDTFHFRSALMKDIQLFLANAFSYNGTSYGGIPPGEAPFIDQTGIPDLIDFTMSKREAEAMSSRTRDWTVTLQFLDRLGLYVEKGQKLTKVVVIRDPK